MSERLLTSRTRAESDWACGRKRYWQYEFGGVGLEPETTILELYVGTVLHDGLAAIAAQHKAGKVDIDKIATTAANELKQALLADNDSYEGQRYANEQSTLVEGLLRGYHRVVWPSLIADYPEVVGIESELHMFHDVAGKLAKDGKFNYICIPDLVLSNGKELKYIEYKSSSSKKDQWISSWSYAVQVHATAKAIEESYRLPCSTQVVGLYKGWESYGKLTSPLVYGYFKSGNPPFQKEEWCLSPTTRVLTSDLRWITVGSLIVGHELAGFDENPRLSPQGQKQRHWQNSKVLAVGRKTLPCLKVTLSDGTSVVCSKQHRWLTGLACGKGMGSAKWRRADELLPLSIYGHRASRIYKVVEPWPQEPTLLSEYLRGAFEGEGSLTYTMCKHNSSKGAHLCFSQNIGSVLTEVKSKLESFGFPVYESKKSGKQRTLTINRRRGVIEILGQIRPQRLLNKWDLSKLGTVRPGQSPLVVVAVEEIGDQEVVTLHTSTGTLVAEGLASHNSYEYKAGLKKKGVWEREGGIKRWVEEMPVALLSEQFPLTPPIFTKDHLVEEYLAQRACREIEIDMTNKLLATADEASKVMVMRAGFPQRFNACQPGWGSACPFTRLCHGQQGVDPTEHGFMLKVKR